MQSDFHYFGTYALARAAGIHREAATIIARSAQYVDDAVEAELPVGKEGIALLAEVTAHRLPDARNTGLCCCRSPKMTA